MESKRRSAVSCAEEDRISNLPEHLVDSILDRVPIQDAVRTSILSKNWRYKWSTMKAMVFDEQLSKKFAKNEAFGRNRFIRIINQVLLLHQGPILKFDLHIPHNISLDNDSYQEVDHWMLFLSRNGVTEIIITNWSQRYELPSHVFSCRELRKLELMNFILKRPLEFERFLNLEKLFLNYIDFGANQSGTQIILPQLKQLSLSLCTNVHNFNLKATKLQNLFVFNCPDAMLLHLLNNPCLTGVGIKFDKPIEEFARVENITLAMMLSNLPNIKVLCVNGLLFKVLITLKIPKWLSHTVNTLKHLRLVEFQLGDLDQLEVALCLLRNSPNLERLYVRFLQMESQVINSYDVGPASDHLESPNCLDFTLSRLQNVEIQRLQGSKPELLFIKLLLAHSPSLNKFTIMRSVTCDVQKRLDISMDVMRFPRASPKAQLVQTLSLSGFCHLTRIIKPHSLVISTRTIKPHSKLLAQNRRVLLDSMTTIKKQMNNDLRTLISETFRCQNSDGFFADITRLGRISHLENII